MKQFIAEALQEKLSAPSPTSDFKPWMKFAGCMAQDPEMKAELVRISKIIEEEFGTLNRIVNVYIEFAELRALQRKLMTMRDWIVKLDEFLKLSEHELPGHAGKISAEQAWTKAELEYTQYQSFLDASPRAVDADFEKAAKELKKLPKSKNREN